MALPARCGCLHQRAAPCPTRPSNTLHQEQTCTLIVVSTSTNSIRQPKTQT